MNLLLNRVYGIVYRTTAGVRLVFNARVVAKTVTTTTIRFMNANGVIVTRVLRNTGITRAVLI
jgi:hypothetical protein